MDGKQVGGTIRHAPDLQAVANWPVETTGGKKIYHLSIIYQTSVRLSIRSTFEAYK